MAHNHRMQPIANPYINDRNDMIAREQEIRSRMQMPLASPGYPGLEGRSNMQDDYDDDEEQGTITDADLMPDTNIPINPAIRAFQGSGHGVQIKKGKEGQ
jgi:hypothetical protein